MENVPGEGEKKGVENMKQWLEKIPRVPRKPLLIGLLLLSIGLLGLLVFMSRSDISFKPKPEYTTAYTLVAPSISESANIIIHLPQGVSGEVAKQHIHFHPDIDGTWVTASAPDMLVFDPKNSLKVGKYYTVTLTTPEGAIGKDFLAEEDPAVAAVFPRENSETNEKSNITVVFNRPMIPVTTLDKTVENTIPVIIEPATPGKFKWVGTRTVQFIPDTTLKASTNYRVSVPADLPSFEGIRIASAKPVTFTTRHLRYEGISEGVTRFNQPIQIRFNQPVDLQKTIGEISVSKVETNEHVEVSFEYGKKQVYNAEKKITETSVDESVITVIQKKDTHGRKNLWDFTQRYSLTIKKAYPKDGDITLDETRTVGISVPDVVESWTATSERTSFATPVFFDPEGKLVIRFFEDIDLARSAIDAPHIQAIVYGEKCKEDKDGETYFYSDVPCEKVPDKRTIHLTVQKDKFALGDHFQVALKRIVNIDGLTVNPNVITKEITLPPILKVWLPNTTQSKESSWLLPNINNLVLCSNSPIGKNINGVADGVTASPGFDKAPVWRATRVVPPPSSYGLYSCEPGEYETTLYYGLAPKTTYTLTVPTEDPFGSKQAITTSFTTEEMPAVNLVLYPLQDQYVVTTPDKTKIAFASENMEYIDVSVCKVSAETLLKYVVIERPNYLTAPSNIGPCLSSATKRMPVARRYWVKNYSQFDLKEFFSSADALGSYVVTVTHPNYRQGYSAEGQQVYERTLVSVTNLSVVEKRVEMNSYGSYEGAPASLTDEQRNGLSNLYWITDSKTLNPVEGAKVTAYKGSNNANSIEQAGPVVATKQSGLATTAPQKSLIGVIVSNGSDTTILPTGYVSLQWGSNAEQTERFYLYTDRPIYRPLHTVHIKGLYRNGYDGAYTFETGKKQFVKVFDSRNTELLSQEVVVSDFGTFETDFSIPKDAPLGTYRIQVGNFGYSSFEVEEYVPAAFKLEAKAEKEEYVSGDTVTIDVQSAYYFGAELEGGTVEYSIGSQSYYFDKYTDEYFNFGSGWYSCYSTCSYGDKFILRNQVPLGANGKAKIQHTIDLKKMFPNEDERASKIVVVYITVKNSSGQSVTNQVSFIVHAGDYYLGLTTDKFFGDVNKPVGMRVKSVDTQGKPAKVRDVNVSWNKLSYTYSKRQEVDGGFYYQWEEKKHRIAEETFSTDGSGNWSGSYTPKEEGEYELLVRGVDVKGNVITTKHRVYISSYEGASEGIVRPTNNTSLDIVAEKQKVNVGETASFIIKSPFKQGKALVSIERGKIFSYEVIDIKYGLNRYSFPVTEAYIPNIVASVVLLSPNPEVKSGTVYFQVDTSKKELDVTVKAGKDTYLPGEKVTLNFSVKDSSGKPVETELSAAVVDMSVLALKGNPKKNPLLFFYDGFPLTVSAASNIKNILQQIEVPNNTKGGGGGEPSDLATKKRGKFEDTALWQGTILTDKAGKATVTFTLPDNLTTWQVESVGISKDTKLGVAYDEFVAKKNLMVVPVHPRFALPGDEFMIGAKVFNQTNSRQSFTVNYTSSELQLVNSDDAKKTVTLRANETRTVYFRVTIPSDRKDVGSRLAFTLSAKNGRLEDTVEQSILLSENTTYETVATAGVSEVDALRESIYVPGNILPNKGELTVKSSATMGVFLSDALTYLIRYPYSSAEEIASKLEAIAVYKEGMALKNVGTHLVEPTSTFDGITYTLDEVVDLSLAKLYTNQRTTGGYSYFPVMSWYDYGGDPYLTARVATALERLHKVGYSIDEDRQKNAFSFLSRDFLNNIRVHPEWAYESSIIEAKALYALKTYGTIPKAVPDQIRRIINDDKYLKENIGTQSLALLTTLLQDEKKEFGARTGNTALDLLENRIDIDARGAYVKPNSSLAWRYYETTARNTALLLRAQVRAERLNETTPSLIRWLIASRSKDGAWGSTMNTIAVANALVEYLAYTRETESNFTLTTVLPTEKVDTTTFDKDTLFQTRTLVVPTAQIQKNALMGIEFKKENHNRLKNTLYYDMAFRYFLPLDSVAPRDEGFTISRTMYLGTDRDEKTPVTSGRVGDVIKVKGEIILPRSRNYIAIEDFIPGGAELVNFNLATESQGSYNNENGNNNSYNGGYYDYYGSASTEVKQALRPETQEYRDDRLYMTVNHLEAGIYTYEYYIRLLVPGEFQHLPAVVSEKYFPENFGRTGGGIMVVKE